MCSLGFGFGLWVVVLISVSDAFLFDPHLQIGSNQIELISKYSLYFESKSSKFEGK